MEHIVQFDININDKAISHENNTTIVTNHAKSIEKTMI